MSSMEHEFNEACSTSKEECQTSMESNKPSFKLDEPVTTALNINSMTTNNFSVNDENSLSFVVLGKDSVETQASVLASYVDIQQKSMAVDYKSMVLTLNPEEMQEKLSDILQENVMLKETLRLNTSSMEEQFNKLVMWQKEVMNVHEVHKKKFAETRELVNHLKKENNELKTKLMHLQHTDNENTGFETIGTTSESNVIINDAAHTELQQITPKLKIAMSKMNLEECKKYVTCIISEKFAEKALQNKLEEIKLEKELESAMKSLNCIDKEASAKIVENQNCLDAKDKEINYLKEVIALLEEKLQCVLTPIQLHDLLQSSSNLNRQKFVENIKQYNNILQELTECYVKQIERFATIEKSLKEITDILIILDDDNNSKMQFYQYKEKLCHCCKQLADEQVKIISDRQTLIKSQNQFQKIFSDYNSILYELEITIDENTKLNVLKDKKDREKLEEVEQIKLNKQLLEEEKQSLNQEKLNLEKEKDILESQKKSLDMERITLHEDKKYVMQEKISLNEEKMSLDHQSQLYENCEKALKDENELLRQDIQKKDTEFKEIMQQYAQSVEEIGLLRSQLTMYEEDFTVEKRLKESLLDEKNKLDVELQKQIRFNQQLQSTDKPSTNVVQDGIVTNCPKCAKPYHGLPALMEHIEKCID
ncbi:optineurin-like [Nylanderia fulva]|uniref:optineurin-like n=1 Tax=Nylanderia fulva TaxID=613905 RepID=UPI0010FAE6D6|nr:optineurin-like [Nylanderia fulva]XP_029167984.1 optineurin-like [Nylanderia fulva]